MTTYRHKLLARTTHSGSDSLAFYRIDEDTIGVVHFGLWEDMDSSAIETHGKYNVQSGILCLRGFESYGRTDPCFVGQSVRDSLRSCGLKLDADLDIVNEHDGALVAIGPRPSLDGGAFKPGKAWILTVAECMWGYGAKDVAFDGSGNNRRVLERAALGAI